MDVQVRPGDPLSQPTRARVFALLGELRRPAGTDELAAALALHPNGVRLHLERLLREGLVERRRVRRPRGRPRDTWSISSSAQPGGDPPSAYASLSRWLVRALVEQEVGTHDLEETGRLIGRGLAPGQPADSLAPGQPADSLAPGQPEPDRPPAAHPASEPRHASEQLLFDALSSLGFQPQRLPAGPGHVEYRLGNCPYQQAVHERQPLVCALHRGLTQGLVEVIDAGSTVVTFEPRDPDTAGCLVGLERSTA